MSKVIVVGSGLAGLAAAVASAAAEHEVVVYEAAGHAGGRCRSYFDATLDCLIDNGNHLVLSGNPAVQSFLQAIGAGDVLAGLLSLVIPIAAWIRGVPYITLVRMAVNLGIGVLVGTIPIFGDIFDIAFKPNRRNYLLLRRHLGEPRRHTGKDWAFLLLLVLALALIFAIPMVLVIWLAVWLNSH